MKRNKYEIMNKHLSEAVTGAVGGCSDLSLMCNDALTGGSVVSAEGGEVGLTSERFRQGQIRIGVRLGKCC